MTLPRHPRVRILGSRVLHEGRVFRVLRERVRLPSGLEQVLDVVQHPGAVAIAAEDGAGRLLLVRQYRHAVGEWLTEIPAGRLEPGEQPADAARRELEEETSHRARTWLELLQILPAPGFCSERLILFHARDLEPISAGGRPPDPDEEIEIRWSTPAEILAGGIEDAKTLIAAAILLHRAPAG